MSQGLLPYAVEVVEGADTVTGRAGLPLVLETLHALGLDQAIAQHVRVRARQSGYPETEKIEASSCCSPRAGTVSTTSPYSRPMAGCGASSDGGSPQPIGSATSSTPATTTR